VARLAERHRPGLALGSPEDTRAYLRLTLGDRRNVTVQSAPLLTQAVEI